MIGIFILMEPSKDMELIFVSFLPNIRNKSSGRIIFSVSWSWGEQN